MQTVSTAESPIAPPRKLPWYRKLGMQVLVALVLGIVVGFVFPKFATQLKVLGDMFPANASGALHVTRGSDAVNDGEEYQGCDAGFD